MKRAAVIRLNEPAQLRRFFSEKQIRKLRRQGALTLALIDQRR